MKFQKSLPKLADSYNPGVEMHAGALARLSLIYGKNGERVHSLMTFVFMVSSFYDHRQSAHMQSIHAGGVCVLVSSWCEFQRANISESSEPIRGSLSWVEPFWCTEAL